MFAPDNVSVPAPVLRIAAPAALPAVYGSARQAVGAVVSDRAGDGHRRGCVEGRGGAGHQEQAGARGRTVGRERAGLPVPPVTQSHPANEPLVMVSVPPSRTNTAPPKPAPPPPPPVRSRSGADTPDPGAIALIAAAATAKTTATGDETPPPPPPNLRR